jgi:hypothetical protein
LGVGFGFGFGVGRRFLRMWWRRRFLRRLRFRSPKMAIWCRPCRAAVRTCLDASVASRNDYFSRIGENV